MDVVERSISDDVLFVLKTPPPFGGGEIAHQYIYEELRGRYRFLIFSRKRHNKAAQGRIRIANIFHGLNMMLKIGAACLRHRPKVVFLWLPKDLPAFIRTMVVVRALKAMHIKVIGDLHGMGFSFLGRERLKPYFKKQINNFFAVRTLSLSISNSLRSCGFNNIVVPIDNGVRAPEFILGSMPKLSSTLRLLYLGAISDAKGFIRTLYLLLALRRKKITFHLEVVGEWTNAEFRQQAMEMIAQNELTPFIDFAGILSGETKWRAIQNSHFLLHFSEWDGQPLTIIEAMAAGVPTLAHRVGGIPEMIADGENGFFVENSHQAAKILARVVSGEIDYDAVSRAAKETFLRRFTIQKYIKNIEKLVLMDDYAASDTISKNR